MKRTSRLLRKKHRRTADGVTLAELVISSILLGVVLAGVGEIMSLCVYTSIKQFNLVDVRTGLQRALSRIKEDVKMSYSIDSTSTPGMLKLSVPTYYLASENDPRSVDYNPGAPQNPLNGTPRKPGTYVEYAVKSDPDKPDEFLLERSSRDNDQPDIVKQIIAKGIVGPFKLDDNDTLPDVFIYLQKHRYDTLPFAEELKLPNQHIDGVSVNFELRRPEKTDQVDAKYRSIIGIRGEAFARIPPG